ncbi:MAG: hypothetical protein IH945_03265 [Armatimonadetes bacterium]|nr:hypothetical protein [Armatimonadota bacterium]
MARVWRSDRQDIGWWSNGYEKKAVEHVTWLSPDLVSRWLGFLQAREYWPEEELLDRWDRIAAALGGSRTFVVELSAFPKLPTYEIGDYRRTTPEEIDNVRFVYTSGGRAMPMPAVRLAARQSRRRSDLEGFAWWQLLEFGGDLTGEFEAAVPEWPLPLGDYYRSWYLVSIEDPGDDSFEVRVLSRRKERVARFVLQDDKPAVGKLGPIPKIRRPESKRPARKSRRTVFGKPSL